MASLLARLEQLLGRKELASLLDFSSPRIPSSLLNVPSPGSFKNVFAKSDRPRAVIKNLERLYNHGRLRGTGYLSILPVDQDIEHSAGHAFVKNSAYFDPAAIVRLAIEGGCNAVASTAGILGMVSAEYARRIPFIVKLNHNDLLRFPNDYDQILFTTVERAAAMGAAGVGATIYFASPESKQRIPEIAAAFAEAHRRGLFTVLWCYVRNGGLRKGAKNYEEAADLTAQAVHLGATVGADIVKQKIPTLLDGFRALSTARQTYGLDHAIVYKELLSAHPIDMVRYQVLNAFAGRVPLISSGGASVGAGDFAAAARSAIINKRAGGSGLILGRKAFQRPFEEGVEMLNLVQDIYAAEEITIA